MRKNYKSWDKWVWGAMCGLLLWGLVGCGGPPFNKKNYDECRPLLEEARTKARKEGWHSYSHEDYTQCRRPAHLR